MTDISTNIGSVNFNSCLMNAAGVWCMTAEELNGMVASDAATFVTKTATLEARPGNPKPRYWRFEQSSINSMGLPNLSMAFYLDYLCQDEANEKRFLSLAPIKPNDLETLIPMVNKSDYKGSLELNLSCPNIPGKPQMAYDLAASKRLLDYIFSATDLQIGVKLPPFFDLVYFDEMAALLNQYPLTFVTSINSLGNGLVIDDLMTTIAPKNGFGGIGGACIKPTALANVHAFRQRLNPNIQVIGAGGVVTGRDVFEHILCGADMVQVGTTLYEEGPQVFTRLKSELVAEMEKYNFIQLSDFKNKLQYMPAKD